MRTWEPIWRGGLGVVSQLIFVSGLAAGVFSGVPAAAGQASGEKEIATQEVQSPFKVQVQRNMVVVRVIVRDSNGRPVPALRKEDFRLLDNGKPQEIDQFALESSSRTSATVRPAPGKEPEEEAASEAGAVKVTTRNYQALYFDDVQMKFEDIAHARDAADRYLASALTPADRAGIFTSSGQDNLDFTDDRSKLHEALFKLRPRPMVSGGADQNQWQTEFEGVLRGLEQVILRTALLPGQRSIIFLSPGFPLYNLEFQVEEVTDRALRSSVVVSTLDPRGVYVISPDPMGIRQERSFLAEEVLYGLAADTGGQFFHNSSDLDKGFREVGTLSDVYYVLAFSPRILKFDGRFHRLKVSLVNPAGFTLQARRGYFAPKASEDAATRAKEEIEQAVYSQDESKELPVDVHTQFFKVNEAQARLAVLTHLDLSSVRFRKEQDHNLNNLTFVTVLFDRDGNYVMGKEKQVEFRLRDSTLARLMQTGITLKMEFDLKPGTYLVRQIVRDSEAGQLSGLNRTVEIPY
jgi:VWFA-related protein